LIQRKPSPLNSKNVKKPGGKRGNFGRGGRSAKSKINGLAAWKRI